VLLILDTPTKTQSNTLVQNDRELREALETCMAEVLSFGVAFTKPKSIQLSIKGSGKLDLYGAQATANARCHIS
jgi:hypothetical protein